MTEKSKKAGLGRCPLCRKPAQIEYRPFCGKRCADLDLGQWLNEGYRIPAVESSDDTDPEMFDADDPESGGGSGRL